MVRLQSLSYIFLSEIATVKYIPEWFPYASFQRLGKRWKAEVEAFRDLPFQYAKDSIVKKIPLKYIVVTVTE